MRNDRGYNRGGRGGGGGGRKGGGRGGRGRHGGGGGGRRGRGGYGRRQQRDPRQSSESGNQRERIAIESGHLVLIDQFMLANPQFIDRLVEIIDEGPEVKDNLVREFGGSVVDLQPGTYRIERDPFAYSIVVHPEGNVPDIQTLPEVATQERGQVFVDTRCLAMIDRELLDDSSLLEKYQQLWFSGQDKACRDLLRDNGGAVRYGFHRNGDELGVYTIPDEDVVCLWPDGAQDAAAQEGGQEAAE